jgi:tetratricopeptide (TPR) repeat protein
MNGLRSFLKYIVTFSCISWGQMAVAVDNVSLNELFSALPEASQSESRDIEADILRAFSDSGSDAMDHLLEQGLTALEVGDSLEASEHFTALIDHAPNFAEGYHARATAYYHLGLVGAAMSDIAQALTLEPRHFGALSHLGGILEELGRTQEALEVLYLIEQMHPFMRGLSERIQRLEQSTQGSAL